MLIRGVTAVVWPNTSLGKYCTARLLPTERVQRRQGLGLVYLYTDHHVALLDHLFFYILAICVGLEKKQKGVAKPLTHTHTYSLTVHTLGYFLKSSTCVKSIG